MDGYPLPGRDGPSNGHDALLHLRWGRSGEVLHRKVHFHEAVPSQARRVVPALAEVDQDGDTLPGQALKRRLFPRVTPSERLPRLNPLPPGPVTPKKCMPTGYTERRLVDMLKGPAGKVNHTGLGR